MSRSGYVDDMVDDLAMGRWRGMVASAARGKRGQVFLKDLLVALDEMSVKELIAEDLIDADGAVCALGALGVKRGIDMTGIDPEESEVVASVFGIADCLAREVVFMNDEYFETPENRWIGMRAWVAAQIKEAGPSIVAQTPDN